MAKQPQFPLRHTFSQHQNRPNPFDSYTSQTKQQTQLGVDQLEQEKAMITTSSVITAPRTSTANSSKLYRHSLVSDLSVPPLSPKSHPVLPRQREPSLLPMSPTHAGSVLFSVCHLKPNDFSTVGICWTRPKSSPRRRCFDGVSQDIVFIGIPSPMQVLLSLITPLPGVSIVQRVTSILANHNERLVKMHPA